MVNHPTISTLWEGWEIGSSTYGGGTYNHGWTGGPLSIMSAYVAGIQPTSLGYNTYIIKPQLGNLQNVAAKVQTVKGFVEVAIESKGNGVHMVVNTINAKGIIAIPKYNATSVLINNKTKNKQVKYKNQDSNYWYYTCNTKGVFIIDTK
jgi:alpha-L-rhamnosidase